MVVTCATGSAAWVALPVASMFSVACETDTFGVHTRFSFLEREPSSPMRSDPGGKHRDGLARQEGAPVDVHIGPAHRPPVLDDPHVAALCRRSGEEETIGAGLRHRVRHVELRASSLLA